MVLGIAASFVVWHQAYRVALPDVAGPLLVVPPSKFASLEVDFGDGTRREFRGEVVPDMSVLEALAYAAEAADMHLAYAPTRAGIRVAAIGGKKSESRARWTFYVNGRKGEDPMTHLIHPQDEVEWRYE